MSAAVTPDLSIAHCFGCYDPEKCEGIDPRTRHCKDCVLDDEFCEGAK